MIKFKDKSINLDPNSKSVLKSYLKLPEIQKYLKEYDFASLFDRLNDAPIYIDNRIISAVAEILIKSGTDIISSLSTIPSHFLEESNVQYIDIGPNIQIIKNFAFDDCQDLKEVNIKGNNLSIIGMSAFRGCVNLEKINFPKSLRAIDTHAFDICRPLEEINYAGTIEELKKIKYLKNMKPIEFVEPINIFENDILFHCADGDVQYSDAIEMWEILK